MPSPSSSSTSRAERRRDSDVATRGIVGSAHYVAREQVRGERATAAVDIYALGVVLYEALTGAPSFTGESASQIIAQKNPATAPQPAKPGIARSRLTCNKWC